MRTIRWGILGCGDVTEVKSGPGFQKARGSALVAVMRRDGAKAADYAKRHGVARWYDDADRLIADKEVDAVYVATPPGTHEFYAMKVLAAGKACYVEKPMARNGAEARRMVEGFKGKGVPLFVAYYRRALPRFLKVKEMIESGELGKVTSAMWYYQDERGARQVEPVPWRVQPEHSGGGLFLDMASHALDLMDFWLGPVHMERAERQGYPQALNKSGTYAVEDTVYALLRSKALQPGQFHCSFAGGREDQLVVNLYRAEVQLSCFGREPIRIVHFARTKQEEHRIETCDLPNPEHVGMPMIQTVVDDLLGIGKCESTGESGLRTQVVMDAALEKYYGGREDGFWLREWPKG